MFQNLRILCSAFRMQQTSEVSSLRFFDENAVDSLFSSLGEEWTTDTGVMSQLPPLSQYTLNQPEIIEGSEIPSVHVKITEVDSITPDDSKTR